MIALVRLILPRVRWSSRSMLTNDWRTAVHEAAHAVCAVAQNGRAHFAAVDDGGVCSCECNSQDANAFMYAAGPEAEYLADEFSAPELVEVATVEVASYFGPVEANDRIQLAARQVEKSKFDNPTDEQFIA